MDAECRYGQTDRDMTDFGVTEWPMDMAGSSTLKAMSTKESGRKTRPMDTVYTLTTMAAGTRANGTQTSSTVLELSSGLMARSTTASMSRE